MAIILKTICDLCPHEPVDASTWTISIARKDKRVDITADIDLCHDHAGRVEDLAKILEDEGRKPSTERRRKSKRHDSDGGFSCDVCEFVSSTPQGLGAHKSRTHGIKGQSDQAKQYRAEKEKAS